MDSADADDELTTGVVPPAEVTLDPQARSVAEARRAARDALVAWDAEACEWVVSQLVSELATNAVLHAGTVFRVVLTLRKRRLRCEVIDGSVRPPRLRHYTPEASTGRGLRLVDKLSSAWGVVPGPRGKTVWFELDSDAGDDVPEPDLDAFLDADDLDLPPVRTPSRATGAALCSTSHAA